MFWERKAENRRKTILLFLCFFLLTAAVGWAAWFLLRTWMAVAIIGLISGAVGAGAMWLDQSLVLWLARPREATHEEFQRLSNVVDEMAVAAQIPAPRCLVIDSSMANAFATGTPGKGTICITSTLLHMLDRDELSGVIAHEMAHIGNYDTRVMTVAFVFSGMITTMCDLVPKYKLFSLATSRSSDGDGEKKENKGGGILQAILAIVIIVIAPIIAKLLLFAVSRQREFHADAEATRLTRNPKALAAALRKLADTNPEEGSAKIAFAHLYIVNPIRQEGFMHKMLSTHPPIGDRIARLESM